MSYERKLCDIILGKSSVFLQNIEGAFAVPYGRFTGKNDEYIKQEQKVLQIVRFQA